LENSDLLLVLVLLYLEHFPAEHHINASLVALVESYFIGISELVDFFVWCPVLNSGVGSCTSEHLVLSHKVLVVKGVEVSSLAFVGELRRVAN